MLNTFISFVAVVIKEFKIVSKPSLTFKNELICESLHELVMGLSLVDSTPPVELHDSNLTRIAVLIPVIHTLKITSV